VFVLLSTLDPRYADPNEEHNWYSLWEIDARLHEKEDHELLWILSLIAYSPFEIVCFYQDSTLLDRLKGLNARFSLEPYEGRYMEE